MEKKCDSVTHLSYTTPIHKIIFREGNPVTSALKTGPSPRVQEEILDP